MKGLSLISKVIFFINGICAVLLILGYALPYIPPRIFPRLSVLSLMLPVLILLNALFLLYWVLRGKRQLLLSAFVLVLGFGHITSLYHFGEDEPVSDTDSISILSYNVRTFNRYEWSKEENIGGKILEFVISEDPDIVCFQEYHPKYELPKSQYPFKYKKMIPTSKFFGQIIYSKYPIIDSGSLDFKKSGNNAIYADIVKNSDTLRVYNVHFESLGVSSQLGDLKEVDSKRLLGRMGLAFKKQEIQLMQFLDSERTSPYPVVVAGDFNNSATSYLYRKVKGEKNDAFAVAGSGTGRTFMFDFIPLRIDFILTDPVFDIIHFKNYNIKLSDHYPVMSSLKHR